MAHFVYLNVVLRHFLGAMFVKCYHSVVPEETKKGMQFGSLQDIFIF